MSEKIHFAFGEGVGNAVERNSTNTSSRNRVRSIGRALVIVGALSGTVSAEESVSEVEDPSLVYYSVEAQYPDMKTLSPEKRAEIITSATGISERALQELGLFARVVLVGDNETTLVHVTKPGMNSMANTFIAPDTSVGQFRQQSIYGNVFGYVQKLGLEHEGMNTHFVVPGIDAEQHDVAENWRLVRSYITDAVQKMTHGLPKNISADEAKNLVHTLLVDIRDNIDGVLPTVGMHLKTTVFVDGDNPDHFAGDPAVSFTQMPIEQHGVTENESVRVHDNTYQLYAYYLFQEFVNAYRAEGALMPAELEHAFESYNRDRDGAPVSFDTEGNIVYQDTFLLGDLVPLRYGTALLDLDVGVSQKIQTLGGGMVEKHFIGGGETYEALARNLSTLLHQNDAKRVVVLGNVSWNGIDNLLPVASTSDTTLVVLSSEPPAENDK